MGKYRSLPEIMGKYHQPVQLALLSGLPAFWALALLWRWWQAPHWRLMYYIAINVAVVALVVFFFVLLPILRRHRHQ